MSKTMRTRTATRRKSDSVASKSEVTSPATAVDTSRDHDAPDAPVAHVVRHARALASMVLAHLGGLTRAKVSSADADALVAGAAALESAERAWVHRYDQGGVGQVAKHRAPLRVGRDDLYDALRTYADGDDDTQRTLDDIWGVDGDDDLARDTVRLLALARRHADDLDGTDIDPAFLERLHGALASFEAARSVARTAGREVDAALVAARAQRNRAFWALAALDRTVVKRCQFGLRREPEVAAQFTSYHNALRRRRKPAATPTPAPVTG